MKLSKRKLVDFCMLLFLGSNLSIMNNLHRHISLFLFINSVFYEIHFSNSENKPLVLSGVVFYL